MRISVSELVPILDLERMCRGMGLFFFVDVSVGYEFLVGLEDGICYEFVMNWR